MAFELLRFDASPALSGSNGRRILDRWIVVRVSLDDGRLSTQ